MYCGWQNQDKATLNSKNIKQRSYPLPNYARLKSSVRELVSIKVKYFNSIQARWKGLGVSLETFLGIAYSKQYSQAVMRLVLG